MEGPGALAGAVTGFSHELSGLPEEALVEGMLLVGMEPGPGVSQFWHFLPCRQTKRSNGTCLW